MFADQPGRRLCISRESLDELGRKDVQSIGIAVMAEIPDDLCAGVQRGAKHGEKRAEVEIGATIDQRPTESVPSRADTNLAKHRIIFERLYVMLNPRYHIHSFSQRIDLTGGLESGHPKRCK